MAIRRHGQLTPKENLFVAEYLKDFNAAQAAIRAGYSKKTARNIACENLTKPHIQTAIVNSGNSLKNLTDQALMEALELEQHLDALIRFNLKDFVNENGEPKSIHGLTYEQAACNRELGIIETQIGSHRSLKFYDKIQAIKLKMQRLGLLKETVNMNTTVETYEQMRKRLMLDDPDVQRMMNEED